MRHYKRSHFRGGRYREHRQHNRNSHRNMLGQALAIIGTLGMIIFALITGRSRQRY